MGFKQYFHENKRVQRAKTTGKGAAIGAAIGSLFCRKGAVIGGAVGAYLGSRLADK